MLLLLFTLGDGGGGPGPEPVVTGANKGRLGPRRPGVRIPERDLEEENRVIALLLTD